MINRHSVVRCFNDRINERTGAQVTYDLMNMMCDMRDRLKSKNTCIITDTGGVKWSMSRDTFNWIVTTCTGEPEFNWCVELNCIGPNSYTIMDIEVEFVEYEYMHKNRIVELLYIGPEPEFDKWVVRNYTGVEIMEENTMKSFYVGYGKKVTIDNVIFNNPATIVFWSDGTKTVVKKQKGDKKFDPEKGLAMAICKKMLGNKGNFNDIFKEWIKED